MKKTIAACVLALAASAFASETRMLFLGNSITWHQYYPSIGWEHEWGMAASEESKDWVHLFAGGYGQATDTAPVMRVRNIADFERGWDSFDVENDADLALDVAFAPDIVIVAIGENVPDVSSSQAAFKAKFKALCEKFPSVISSGKFLIRAPFWNNPTLDAIMLEVAEELGTLYVDSSVCDTPANRAGEYASVNGGIAAHPGDSGMAAMAAQMLLAYGIGEAESSGDEEETGSEESGATSPAVVVTRAGEYAAADGIGEAVSGAPAAGGSSIRRLSNGEYVHVFASSGTFRAPASCAIDIQYLAVGGGGGGGALMGGGGGAGAVVTGSYLLPAGETIAISVGIGGAGGVGSQGANGANGGETTMRFSGQAGAYVSALGGGAGAAWSGIACPDAGYGRDGACGGGGGGAGGEDHHPGAGLQGNDGGAFAIMADGTVPGGGGGAGTPGRAAYMDYSTGVGRAGNGGDGITCAITGADAVYGAGGAGGSNAGYSGGGPVNYTFAGGTGGSGGACGGGVGEDALSGTGSGGGGGGWGAGSDQNGGAGGSGIVIIRYAVPADYSGEIVETLPRRYGIYEMIDGIQSDHFEQIDTGVMYGDGIVTEVEITPNNASSINDQSAIFGSSWDQSGYFMMFYQGAIRFNADNDYADVTQGPATWRYGERVTIAAAPDRFRVNGGEWIAVGNGRNNANQIRLFWVGNAYTLSRDTLGGYFMLHHAVISNSTAGVLLRDFRPVKRVVDGAIGLYDVVTGGFFGNTSGTGVFAADETLTFGDGGLDLDYVGFAGAGETSAGFSVALQSPGETPAEVFAIYSHDDFSYREKIATLSQPGYASATLGGLRPGTLYDVYFEATDASGATARYPARVPYRFSTAAESNAAGGEYSMLDYIEGHGLQQIDTGVGYTDDLVTEVEVTAPADDSAHLAQNAIFGCAWAGNGYFMMFANGINFNVGGSWVVTPAGTQTWQPGERTMLTGLWNGYYVNGTWVPVSQSGGNVSAYNVYLFWTGDNVALDRSQHGGYFKLHHCVMSNTTGTVYRDFAPAIRNSDGAVGLYDSVTRSFYANSAYGAFTAGAVLSQVRVVNAVRTLSRVKATVELASPAPGVVQAYWGAGYGGIDEDAWEYGGPVAVAGENDVRIDISVAGVGADARYLRLRFADGQWSDTVFISETAREETSALVIIVR